jgi:hypothetical protein
MLKGLLKSMSVVPDSDDEGSDDFPFGDIEETKQANTDLLGKEGEGDTQSFIEQALRERLKRRTDLIAEMRAAYLRDVLAIKIFVKETLNQDERAEIYSNWKDTIPSIDLRQHFMLYSPHETSMNVIPCENCGGSIEIVHHESSEIEALSKALFNTDKNKEELKVIIGTRAAQIEALEHKLQETKRKHQEEVSHDNNISLCSFIILF